MPVRIKLSEGESLLVDVDLEDWNRAFHRALENNEMLEIEDRQGRVLGINPNRVLYLMADGSDAEMDQPGRRQPARAAG